MNCIALNKSMHEFSTHPAYPSLVHLCEFSQIFRDWFLLNIGLYTLDSNTICVTTKK